MLKMSLFILLSIVLSIISMPIIIHFCNKHNLYDYQDARKIHSGNISRLGGVGIAFAFTTAAALYLIFNTQLSTMKSLPILIAGLIIFGFGLLDDILTLPAIVKLIVQLAASALVTFNGYRFTQIFGKCKKDFGKPPILKTRNEITAEDYRDIVESIKFSVGGFHEGHTDITITKNENGAFVNVEQFLIGDLDIPENRQISPARWKKIVNTLYNQLYLHEWKKKYVDPLVLDGTQWSLDIKLTNGRKREYYGSNLYPPYWPELKKIFRPFAKIR